MVKPGFGEFTPLIGIALHADPYLILLFFRPQEVGVWTDGPDDSIEGAPVWSMREGRADIALSEAGERLTDAVVTAVRNFTPAVHDANDYPSVSLLSDDQIVVSVHPLDRAAAVLGLTAALRSAGFQAVLLPHVAAAGPLA